MSQHSTTRHRTGHDLDRTMGGSRDRQHPGQVRIVPSISPAPTHSGTASQHIAFATDDIISASRRVRDSGRGLPVPDNCCDDLPARFASGSGELATDREPGCLHDHDENGRFQPLE